MQLSLGPVESSVKISCYLRHDGDWLPLCTWFGGDHAYMLLSLGGELGRGVGRVPTPFSLPRKEHFDSEVNSSSTSTCILPQLAKSDRTAHCTARYQLTRRLGGTFYLFVH